MTFALQPVNKNTGIDFSESKSLTEQSHAESCEIHNILKRHAKTGVIDHLNKYEGSYGDFSNSVDLQAASNILIDAQNMFDSIPSKIRRDFDNSPAQFLDFIQNPDNRDAIEAYGLSTSHFPPKEEKPKKEPKEPKEPKTPKEPKKDA